MPARASRLVHLPLFPTGVIRPLATRQRRTAKLAAPWGECRSPGHMDLQLSPQNENVLFCKVEMSYSQTSVALAIPLWMHDVASRPAVKATLRRIEPRGFDDTRPRCEGRTVMRGMARLFWRDSKTCPRQVLFGRADISTLLRHTGTFSLRSLAIRGTIIGPWVPKRKCEWTAVYPGGPKWRFQLKGRGK